MSREVASTPALSAIREDITKGAKLPAWAFTDDLITFKGCVFVPPSSASLPAILAFAKDLGPEGTQMTLSRLRADFHISQDRATVQDFVHACLTCQWNKTEHLQPTDLLQSLPVPSAVWADIAMEFVEGLPRVHGKTVIVTVPTSSRSHPYMATSVAADFFAEIVRLHGFRSPSSATEIQSSPALFGVKFCGWRVCS